MRNISDDVNLIHFADDTTLYASDDNLVNLSNTITNQLELVDIWLRANRLSLNVQKTSYMIFTHNKIHDHVDIRLRDTVLKRVHFATFLGITIDDKLRFDKHVVKVVCKLSRALGIIYRLRELVPPYILKTLFYSLYYPHLIYGITIWGRSSVSNFNNVNRIHNRICKLLKTNLEPLDYNCIMSLDNIHMYFCILKFFKCINDSSHIYFGNKLITLLPAHFHSTRFCLNKRFICPFYKKSLPQRYFFYLGIKYWNDLPDHIKSNNMLPVFKRDLKNLLLLN